MTHSVKIRSAAGALAVLAALAAAACGPGDETADGREQRERGVAQTIKDATALIAAGDVDAYLATQCDQVRKDVADDPSLRSDLAAQYADLSVRMVVDIDITGDTALAKVIYEKKSDALMPVEISELRLVRTDGRWELC